MTLGTLRDQVIYPDTFEDQKKKGISDQVQENIITIVINCCFVHSHLSQNNILYCFVSLI